MSANSQSSAPPQHGTKGRETVPALNPRVQTYSGNTSWWVLEVHDPHTRTLYVELNNSIYLQDDGWMFGQRVRHLQPANKQSNKEAGDLTQESGTLAKFSADQCWHSLLATNGRYSNLHP